MCRALCLILAAATVTGAATACVGPTPIPTLPPQPTATPVFASEEEALAAATAAYEQFVRVSDEVAAGGWETPGVLNSVAVDPALARELESAEEFAAAGYRQTGTTQVLSTALQQLDPGPPAVVVIYACIDVSEVDLVDSAGTSLVPDTRPDVIPVEIQLAGDAALMVSGVEQWGGPNFC